MMDSSSLKLVEVIQKLSLCRTLEEIIEIVRHSAREMAGADGATFVLREGDQCHYVDEDALGPLFKGNHFPSNICISGAAMEEKRTIVVPDIYKDDRIPIEVYRPTFVKSLCMTPIRNEAPVGSIGVYWKDLHHCTPDEVTLLSILANSCSIAMENVYLQTRLKAELEQVQRLSRLKDEFLRNLSHELRTPLNQIMGWIQLLEDGATSEELAEGLRAMSSSGARQEMIIKDLLDCASLVSGEMKFHTENFDLGDLIKPTLDTFQTAIHNKKLTIKLVSSTTGSLVNADRVRCREILWHLLSNAIKFSPIGGTISVQCYRNDENSIVSVSDKGIGIEKDFMPRAFDLFAQVESGLTKSYSGTGLGLSISRYLAEAQGGHVELKSEGLGHGAIAAIHLPTAAIRFIPKRNADPAYMANVFDHLMRAPSQALQNVRE